MAVQRAVAERWKALTGCAISEGYGLSETSPVATANRFSATDFTGTIGLPLPSTDIAIRDDDGHDLPIGEPGEICIRGPQVMAGYWNRPDETAKVMTPDGFFKSGDMGFMDERGYVKIVDRKKDMILVSGFNVYPNEIEDVVALHPGVLEVRGDRRAGRAFRRSAEALHRQEGPGADRRGRARLLQGATSPATSARSTSSSAPTCRRRRSARFCAASCGGKGSARRRFSRIRRHLVGLNALRCPLCPAGHLPHEGGDQARQPSGQFPPKVDDWRGV